MAGAPDHLSVVTNLNINTKHSTVSALLASLGEIVSPAAVVEELLLREPGLDGEVPGDLVAGDEDVLPTGPEPLGPAPRTGAVAQTAALSSVALSHPGCFHVPGLPYQGCHENNQYYY